MAAAQYTTLLEVVNLVARSVGHPATTDVPSSTDEAILRMAYYVNIAGSELAFMHNWQWLAKDGLIDVVADFPDQSEKAFDLPADFHAFVDDTMWNRSTQLPAVGPVNAQDWKWLVVRRAMITTRMMWRIRNKQLWIKSPMMDSQPFVFEYVSKMWAVDGTTLVPKDNLVANNDYHLYPWQMFVMFARAKWFENEGYDSTAAYSDFQRAFQYETGSDKGATSLSLVPGTGYPYIDPLRNLPDTGYGAG
ncbi:MAG: hypothetical protein ACHQX3_03725 [Nitrospirales bacterium]